ncbi:MAG: spore cortex-lytic enzyme [Bacilli bacterium]
MQRTIQIAAAVLTLCVLAALPCQSGMAQAAAEPNLIAGSQGPAVAQLQNRLYFLGYYHGGLSGLYTWQTYWAVRDFQYAFGMPITGLTGQSTWAMLKKATLNWSGDGSGHIGHIGNVGHNSATAVQGAATASPGAGSTGSTGAASSSGPANATSAGTGGISSNDINLMAHVVYGEARNQPLDGQVAVAAVILNRCHSSKFPHSIPAIIYQPGAFTSISNGQAWLGLHKENVQAVMDAVHGWDPTHGALYYWNPSTATSSWIWSQPVMLRIGNHVFAK